MYGLRERYELPLTSVANPRDYLVTRWGTPAFCWVAGDGNTPTVGPALTATGAPGSIAGPWELADGTRLPLEVHGGATLRASAAPLDPAVGEDAVVVVIGRMPPAGAAGEVLFSTMAGTGQGITLRLAASNQLVAAVRTAGGAEATSTPAAAHVSPSGVFVAVITYDRTTDTVTLWTPGATGGAGGVTDGAITGGGIGLGALPGGGSPISSGGAILAAAYYVGAGIAPSWAAAARRTELFSLVIGVEPRGNQAPAKGRPVFARASAASWQDDDGRWWIASSGLARAGDPRGYRRAATRTNEVYNTINPSVTTGWSVTGGGGTPATLTAVDDSAALATYKGECWGPNVLKLDNSLGDASAYAYGGATTGNLTARSYQAIARQTGAGGAQVGSRDASAGTFTSHVAVGAGGAHSRVTAANKTPADTDEQYAIHAPAGTVVYFVAAQRETGATCSTPIPNWATAATAVRAAESLTPPLTPRNDRGRVSCGVRLMGSASQESIISRAGGWDGILYGHGSGNWATYDSTTLTTGAARIEETRQSLAVRWSGAVQEITVDGVSASGAYDGSRGGSGTYVLNAIDAGGGEAAIDSLVIEEAA
jgi:hypothetical protein